MRWTWILAVALCAGCGGKGEEGPTEDEVWAVIDGYEGWTQTPSWVGVQPGTGPHGDHVQIWWNDDAVAAYEAATPTLPVGAALVKESYDNADGATVSTITAMWKEDETAWTWAKLDGDGALDEAGALSACSGCHESGTDSVLSESW